VSGVRVGLEASQDLLAADVGQVQVEQDQVGLVLACQAVDELALGGGEQPHPAPLAEQAFDQAQVGGVVLHVQHGVLGSGMVVVDRCGPCR